MSQLDDDALTLADSIDAHLEARADESRTISVFDSLADLSQF